MTRRTLINQLGRAIALLLVLGLVLLLNRYCGMESEMIGPGAKLVAVDGDSLRASNGEDYRIFAIDAPELHQTCTDAKGKEWSCGRAAKTELAKLIKGGDVSCVEQATDKYGRNVAQCGAKGVPDIGEAMVREATRSISAGKRATPMPVRKARPARPAKASGPAPSSAPANGASRTPARTDAWL
ncbi:thermonuclease family protein [Methyloceanibacter stevinii]|nr:thermonuclease family protein [Methyloceanibacter stevinii]